MKSPKHHLLEAAVWLAAVAAAFGLAQAAEPTGTTAQTSPPPNQEQISSWIADLDNNKYLVREQATQHLLTAGPAVMDLLLIVANGDRPEPADRAVWVLKQLGESDQETVASGALTRLMQLERRPSDVKEATQALDRLGELICQRKLAALGGRLTMIQETAPELGIQWYVRVELDHGWKGTSEDLKCLKSLVGHQYFRLDGAQVGDAEMEVFQSMDWLLSLKLYKTSVTVAAVDALKERQPNTAVYVRNRALLGIQGVTRDKVKGGVTVMSPPQPGSAAAAAGLETNDVIVAIDGQELKDFDRLTAQIGQHEPGEKIDVTIQRGEEKLTKQVTLGSAQLVE